jgi:RNA polymerase sigma factor (sigma-70 family)
MEGQLAPVLRYIRRLGGVAGDGGDRALLERFVRHGDAEAFAALVRRHGPMVLAVCRRALRDGHDADDAFQAVFLLLVRKAGSLRRPEQLGPWLHGVAHRVAVKARSLGLRRRRREQPLADAPAPPAADDLVWRDLRPVLDAAVRSLPAKYRTPFVLCYLQGMTHAEAARHLGCPPGTVATRLSRAREQLRARLVRRGVTLSAAALAAALAHGAATASLPTALVGDVLRAVTSSGVVSSHVTALTEGVCKAMLMEKLRFVVMALVATAAVGALVTGYRLGAAEPGEHRPTPSLPPAPIPAPIAVTLRAEKEGAATAQTTHFEVTAPTRRVAALVAEAAERQLTQKAIFWLGKPLPDWSERCPIVVKITTAGTGGATTFEYDEGQVKSRRMHLEGPLDRLLSSVLPHEVTHIVFADYLGKPMARWADEGGAVLSEDDEERQRHENLARQIVDTPGRAIPLRRLLRAQEYPGDVMVLFAEGYSVTRFLVEKKDNKTFLAFVKQGMDDSWDKAVKVHYDYRDVEALEDAWLADLRRQAKAEPRPIPPAIPVAGQAVGGSAHISAPSTVPPVTGFAVIDMEGHLLLRELGTTYAHGQRVQRKGTEGEDKELVYVPVVQLVTRSLDPAETPVYGMDGRRIDPKRLPELLRKETPVLVSQDGKMVDPFHLQLVKEGSLIVVPPLRPAPPLAVPEQ